MGSATLPELLAPTERIRRAYARIAAAGRPEAWIHLRDETDALSDAEAVERRLEAGEAPALAGLTVSVKDNIDVGGLPTTAGCPAFAYTARADAPAVARLRAAGAIVLGKGNLDQFATGLTGTRSPYGQVGGAWAPERAGGGWSSGSALAVALGLTDLGLVTDTAGSGRVPAAFQGIFAIKPTRGRVSTRGVVPACRSFDTVGVFAADLATAGVAAGVIAEVGGESAEEARDEPSAVRWAVFPTERLLPLSPQVAQGYHAAVERLTALAGAEPVEIEPDPFLEAGELLYGGAHVAERHDAVGSFIEAHRPEVDDCVAEIILAAGRISAARCAEDRARLDRLRLEASATMRGIGALLLPTVPFQPTLAEVAADPLRIGDRLGRFTTFANPLELCAVALPCAPAGSGAGVTLLGRAHEDAALLRLARALAQGPAA